MVAHPLYERLLERFCGETALDARALREMVEGVRPADPLTVDLMSSLLGVPKSAWAKRTRATTMVTGSPDRQGVRVTDLHREALRGPPPRKRRKHTSRVHEVIDRLGWKMADLAARVSADLGRKVSRPSLQNYAAGQRSITHGNLTEARIQRVAAPLDVRQSAERVTMREAKARKLGEEAVLRASEWPNVSDGV